MPLRPILVADEPILRERTKRVPSFDAGLHRLLDDMLATMRDAPGVGLAANQVGVGLQVAITEIEGRITELVNPQIVKSSGEQLDWEGCLSIPGYVAEVSRAAKVTGGSRTREETVLSYAHWLARHERAHYAEIQRLARRATRAGSVSGAR